jgi:RNA polymerase sigma-70 factor (ECF subfamily)
MTDAFRSSSGPAQAPTSACDGSLLQRARAGNETAATQIYLRYAGRLQRLVRAHCSPALARRVDVDDIVQSVFSRFFLGVRQGRFVVPPGEELWQILLVIALNQIRAHGNYHRAAKRDIRQTVGAEELENNGRHGLKRDETSMVFLRLVIDETLERFPPPQQKMIVLRIEGYEVAEIAERTQSAKRSVERVLHDFRQQLDQVLHQDSQ